MAALANDEHGAGKLRHIHDVANGRFGDRLIGTPRRRGEAVVASAGSIVKSGQIKAWAYSRARSLLGESTVDRILLARAYRRYEHAGIVFIHVPKCAGTSVSHALYGQSLGHRTAQELRSFSPDRFDRLYSFAVIRDPLERAHSAYIYLRRGGTKTGWAAPRPEYQEDSFSTFERFATEWLLGRDASDLDYVLQPQSRYVTDEHGKVIVDRLASLDSLPKVWPEIIAGRAVAGRELPVLNAQENKPPATVSSDAIDSLRQFYAEDVALWESIETNRLLSSGCSS